MRMLSPTTLLRKCILIQIIYATLLAVCCYEMEFVCPRRMSCALVPYFGNDVESCACSIYGFDKLTCAKFLFTESKDLPFDSTVDAMDVINATLIDSSSILETYMHYLVTHSECGSVKSTFGELNFAMIQSCPRNVTSTRWIAQCEDPQSFLPAVEYNEYIPLLFRNVYCALCNGLSEEFITTSIVPWKTTFLCNDSNEVTDWGMIKENIDAGRCFLQFDPPEKTQPYCYPSIRDNLEYILNEDCQRCLYDEQLMNTTERETACFLCRFALITSGEMCEDHVPTLSVLFDIPTKEEIEITLNGGQFKTSDLCKDDEQFDLMVQGCRKFICQPNQYPINGQCIENGTIYISPSTQPLANGSSFLYLSASYDQLRVLPNIAFLPSPRDPVASSVISQQTEEQISKTTLEPPLEATAVAEFPIDPLLDDLKQRMGLLDRENRIHSQSPKLLNQNSAIIQFDVSNSTVTDILKIIGSVPAKVYVYYFSLQITNWMERNSSHITCDRATFSCVTEANLYYKGVSVYAEVYSENRTYLLPIDNVLFNLTVSSQKPGLLKLNEVCFCKADLDTILNCSSMLFQYRSHEYRINDKEELEIILHKVTYQHWEYEIKDSIAIVCYDQEKLTGFFDMDSIQMYVSWTCSGISVLALIATVFLYVCCNELRNIPGKITIGLSISLIFGQGLLLLPSLGSDVCRYFAAITHFSWLSAFLWMGAQATHMLKTFRPQATLGDFSEDRVFKRYCVICLLPPGLVCLLLLVLDVLPGDHLHVQYGVMTCAWMSDYYGYTFTFFLPIGLILVANIVCFSLTLYYIEGTMSKVDKVTGRKRDRYTCIIYIKLSSVMGFSWIFGFIAAFNKIPALWYVYIVLNGLQGLFIFLSFSVNSIRRSITKRRTASKTSKSSDTMNTTTTKF